MSLSSDIKERYKLCEPESRRVELVHKRGTNHTPHKIQPDKIWSYVKPKVAAELAPVIKRLTAIEKARLTMKDAETMIDARLAKLEKQNRRSHEALYNKLREL